MCGINGVIGLDTDSSFLLEQMNTCIAHRGPDGNGVNSFGNHGLAHVRLSIIDIDSGAQPMKSSCGMYYLTFNGEIYNYRELRKELIAKGEQFKTNSDSEVILIGYKVFKEGIVKKLRGMFAFAVVDFERQEYFIARDHFGIKPLFYYSKNNQFLFSSELKPISDQVENLKGNKQGLLLYLKYKYVPTPHTIFKDIYKLEKGHYLRVDFNGVIEEKKQFFEVDFSNQRKMSKEEALEEFRAKFIDSVKVHTYSDVPFGVFLSGGVDSSLVSIYLAKILNKNIKAFNIGFSDSAVDESDYAKRVSEEYGLDLISTTLNDYDHDMYSSLIKDHFSEPYADTSCIPTFQVSKLARAHVPMVLGGDGADEAFGGYNSYLWFESKTPKRKLKELKRANEYKALGKLFISEKLNKFKGRDSCDSLEFWNSIMGYLEKPMSGLLNEGFSNEFLNLESIYAPYINNGAVSHLSCLQKSDFETYMMDDVLTKVDRMSMANSLEVRTPFLDVELSKLFMQIPDELKIQEVAGSYHGKYLLKEDLAKYMGADFVYRRKQGFAIPQDTWLRKGTDAYVFMKDSFEKSNLLKNLFKPELIDTLFETNVERRAPMKWMLYGLMLWLEDHGNISFE